MAGKPEFSVGDHRYADLVCDSLLPPGGRELALGLLAYDPTRRWSARRALASTYFTTAPLPQHPIHIANVEGEWHEMEAKHERARQRQADRQKVAAA